VSRSQILKSGDHVVEVRSFRRLLIAWGKKNFRPFPWRATHDPYHLLMAEVMLHRTQASQVVPVYERFIKRFPDVQALARATKEQLHEALYSLGLKHRIDLIHQMAVELMTHFGGQVPKDKADLLSLTGVSDYIASAIRNFGWNLPEPLIDTNTVRVTGRVFMLEIKDSSRRNPRFRELISGLLDPDSPGAYNYALLDLADRICTKKRPPDCKHCPVLRWCMYGTINLSRLDENRNIAPATKIVSKAG
jgi:A/G-specific adenine glycosylase